MPKANLALSHFEREHPGESERVLVNMYAEENGGDPSRPVRLVTTPGTIDRDTGNVVQGNIRGTAQSDAFAGGNVLLLDGTTLRKWAPSTDTWGTITGTVSGSDRADMAFTQTELCVLSGSGLFVSDGATIAAVTDPDFPSGVTSIAALSQRILMSAADGKWYFTSVLDVDDITGLNFYSAESAPDNLVAVRVLGETALMFGGKTLEMWFATGSANDPFSRQSTVVQTGCLCRDGIVILDNGVIWVAEDRTVRTLAGIDAPIISEPWITRALQSVDADDIIASTYQAEGHGFYCLNTPTGCYVYDLATKTWHKRLSDGETTWNWSQIISQDGAQYVAKRTGTAFMQLSRAYATDEQADASTLGDDITRNWTAHIPHEGAGIALGPIILEGSKGTALASGDGSDPVVQMRISNDNGNTQSSWRERSLGVRGDYDARAKWNQNGRGKRPQTVLEFKASEPIVLDVTGVVWGETA